MYLRILILMVLVCSPPPLSAKPLDQFELVDQSSIPFKLSKYKDHYIFLSFVFTRCPMPDMCPLTVSLNKRLQKLWGEKKPKIPIHFVLITLDPQYDTPQVLANYAKSRNLDLKYFTLATGKQTELFDLNESFNIVALPDGVALSHNLKSILLGPGLKELRQYKDNKWTPEKVVSTAP